VLKLCQALGIGRELDGEDLVTSERLFIEQLRRRAHPRSRIMVTPRVGVGYAEEWAQEPLRFHLDSEHVSKR